MNGISALFSSKELEVLAALDEAKEIGDVQWVRPIMELLRSHPSQIIQKEIKNMLSSMKISAASDVFADALEDPDFETIYPDIIGFMWSSGFTPEESLCAIVKCAVEGDFRAAVEALTWIEELDIVHNENQLLDAILMVRGSLEDDENAEKRGLYEAILGALLALERDQ
jgi:hypothetical protein